MEYLYNQTQYFSINPSKDSILTMKGSASSSNCAILNKSDFQSNQDLYLKIAQAIQFGTQEEHMIISLDLSPKESFHINDLELKTCEFIICFGFQAPQLGIAAQIAKNRVYKTETYKMLFTDSLESMKTDSSKKKAFWNVIQTHLKK